MNEMFQTFKPKNPLIKTYVDYYYLDLKPNNTTHAFQCFPHFNNTISLYRSHRWEKNKRMVFDEAAAPLQIFTPVREDVLSVKQCGKVHRIVLVFHPLGIQQFFRNLDFSDFITDVEFFTKNELQKLFSTSNTKIITKYLDEFLIQRFGRFENSILEKAIVHLFNKPESFSVSQLSEYFGLAPG